MGNTTLREIIMDLETVVPIAGSVLAFFLFAISVFSYKREKRKSKLFVTVGFFVFAIEEALIAVQEAFLETKYPSFEGEILTLNFVVLLLFFAGLIKRK
jgi:hypothetical protein